MTGFWTFTHVAHTLSSCQPWPFSLWGPVNLWKQWWTHDNKMLRVKQWKQWKQWNCAMLGRGQAHVFVPRTACPVRNWFRIIQGNLAAPMAALMVRCRYGTKNICPIAAQEHPGHVQYRGLHFSDTHLVARSLSDHFVCTFNYIDTCLIVCMIIIIYVTTKQIYIYHLCHTYIPRHDIPFHYIPLRSIHSSFILPLI